MASISCIKCQKPFKTESGLTWHLEHIHGGGPEPHRSVLSPTSDSTTEAEHPRADSDAALIPVTPQTYQAIQAVAEYHKIDVPMLIDSGLGLVNDCPSLNYWLRDELREARRIGRDPCLDRDED